MNSVAEALNTLISAVNVAHNKGGVYSLEESHYIYMAISYLNSLSQQTTQPVTNQADVPHIQTSSQDFEEDFTK